MTIFKSLLDFMQPFKWRAFLAAFLGFLTIAANIGLMGSSGYLIASAALRPETLLLLWVPIVAVRFFGLSRGVFRYLERLASHDVTFRVLARIRVWLYKRLEPQASSLLEKRRSADLLGSAVSDVEQLQNMYLRVLAPPAIALLTAALGFIILAKYDLYLGMILLIMMIIGGMVIPSLSHRLGKRWGESEIKVRSKMYAETSDLLSGLHELTAFGRVDEAIAKLERTQDQLDKVRFKQNRLTSTFAGLMLAATNLSMWIVLGYSISLVSGGELNGITIPIVVLVALSCFEAVTPLPLAFQHFGQTMAAGQRLFQLAEGRDASNDAEDSVKTVPRMPRDLPSLDSKLKSSVTVIVEGLSFKYGSQQQFALKDISFTLFPSKHIAVVGESGAGKSSIIQALLAMRPYQEGSLRLNGKEILDLSEDDVRTFFAVVSQQPYMFHASVAENIRLAKPNASIEELEKAIRSAQLQEMVRKLPQGMDTIIGEWGSRFSGGERQRLALARALVRQAPIVLMDEPTTGLDPITEQAFLTAMETELKNKSVLWITHRLSGLERMDEILVLHQGQIVERGTHQALFELDGYYRRLWERQKEQLIQQ